MKVKFDLDGYDGFDIQSENMLEVLEAVHDFAKQGHPIIMFGPSGAGKEFLARYYFKQYRKATRCKDRLIRVNCSHLVRETAQTTLFGHKKGAFTDAKWEKPGQFELAKGGVLFLDEIGDLDSSVQTMVNQAMDEEPAEGIRLGATKPYTTKDVKVICATEQPVEKLNNSLKYRTGHHIHVPGLDERDDDVEEAIAFFCLSAIKKRVDTEKVLSKLLKLKESEVKDETIDHPDLQKIVKKIAKDLGPFVRDRDWPGNFRALRQAVDSGVVRAKKMNSKDGFIDDVEKYFHHHLGDYSIAEEGDPVPPSMVHKKAYSSAVSKWIAILKKEGAKIDEKEKIRLCQFLSEFEEIPFKREVFEDFMNLSMRNAQYRIKDLRDEWHILENVDGKGHRYQVCKKYIELGRQGIYPTQFMELPDAGKGDILSDKNLEAQGMIENTRALFISENDAELRKKFLGSFGRSLTEDYDVIYYSFQKHSMEDFLTTCMEHLTGLNIEGWFTQIKDEKPELNESLSGLSGYMAQSLSQHRKTIIILEELDDFNTGELQALIEKMIFYWYPVHFVLGSSKQFFPQEFSSSIGLSELKLSK